MKKRYNAKYNDVGLEINPFRDTNTSDAANKMRVILKMATGLIVFLWAGFMTYFLVFPLIPFWQDIDARLKTYDPYDIGYAAATQFFVSVTPPDYTAEEFSENTDGEVAAVRTERQSIEYVDPDSVTLADLSSMDTVLVVETANIQGKIVDGYTQESMLDGFWHYPESSVPGKRGNTVIFGHRFHRLPPSKNTFFNLDSVKVGDKIRIEQTGTEFTYTVVKTAVADKFDESVLKTTGDYRLTLITCTPLWTSEKRLVVTAVQDRLSSVI
jgi:LPXTG-site transpeptidase (sortase) family protein